MSSRKARNRKKRIESRDVTRLKYFDQQAPTLERLNEVGTQRDKAGKRGESRGHQSDGYLRLATDLLDVPADVIALIYRYDWTIKIFFRFLKQILGCRNLLRTDPVGIEVQTYCAIIACLLIALHTGRRPTKRTYEMICFYFIG